MKLLFVVTNRKPRGGWYSVIKIAEALAERGHSVTLACARYPVYFKGPRNPIEVHVRHQIPFYFKGCGFLDRLWGRAYDWAILSPLVADKKFDYIFGLQKEDAIRAVRLGRKHKVPVVNFVFESPIWIERVWRSFEGNQKFQKSWEKVRRSLIISDKIIAISELAKTETEKWLARKVDGVAYPGIDKVLADSVPQVRKRHQLIYIGALEPRKNIDKAIVALSKLGRRPKFVVCGEGELKRKLKGLARRLRVECEFRGEVSDYEKWAEIKSSLFMVFPTSFEGFGIPPAEALYCKIPCIASDLPILREIYGDKLEYFPPHDVDELAERMRCLLERPDYRKTRGEEGHRYVNRELSWQRAAEEIERCVASAG